MIRPRLEQHLTRWSTAGHINSFNNILKPMSFGGGNDVTNDQMLDLLYNKKAIDSVLGTPEINKKVIQGLVGEIFYRAFDDLIELLRSKMTQIGKPNMPIILHGYDYPFPDGRGWSLGGIVNWIGPWLDPPLSYKGYDR